MRINGGQLYKAIEFISYVYNERIPYSTYVQIKFENNNVTIKACSDVFLGALVSYNEIITDGISGTFVIEYQRLKNFLKNNKKNITIEINDNFILLKGKGNLRLNLISETDYMICNFDDESNYIITPTIEFENESYIDELLNTISTNLKWLDNSTISPQYRDICWNTFLSTRRYKHNISCINEKINQFCTINYNNIIYSDFMRVLSNVESIKQLKLEFNENYTIFEAIATDLNIRYFLKCRAIDGSHPITEITNNINSIISNDIGFSINKDTLSDIVSSCIGYSSKEDVANITIANNEIQFTSTNDGYNYDIKEQVLTTIENLTISFNLNLTAFNDILSSLLDTNITILVDSASEVNKLVIVDNIKGVKYLFPTWN